MKRIALLALAAFFSFGFNFANETVTACSALTGSYVSKNTVAGNTRVINIQNTCNQTIRLSDDGTTDGMTLLPGMGGAWEFKDYQRDDSEPGITLYVKHNGVTPTAGTLIITVMH